MNSIKRLVRQRYLSRALTNRPFSQSSIENPLDPSLRLFPVTELVRTHSIPTSPSFLNPTSLSFSESELEYIVSIPVSCITPPSLHLFDETFLVVEGLIGDKDHHSKKGLDRREFSLAHPMNSSQIKATLDPGSSRLEIKFDKVHVFKNGDDGEGVPIPVHMKA